MIITGNAELDETIALMLEDEVRYRCDQLWTELTDPMPDVFCEAEIVLADTLGLEGMLGLWTYEHWTAHGCIGGLWATLGEPPVRQEDRESPVSMETVLHRACVAELVRAVQRVSVERLIAWVTDGWPTEEEWLCEGVLGMTPPANAAEAQALVEADGRDPLMGLTDPSDSADQRWHAYVGGRDVTGDSWWALSQAIYGVLVY